MLSKIDKKCIIDAYLMIISEYFNKFIESEICNYETNIQDMLPHYNIDETINANLLSGIMIIHRVFEYTFIKTKNISSAYYYSNEAITYYLEYVGQMQRANYFKGGNDTDTVLFVYKKTIFELFDNDNKSDSINHSVELGGKSILSNILQSTKDNTSLNHITSEDFGHLFELIKKITNLLLLHNDLFNNNDKPSYLGRVEFCQKFLESFLKNLDKIEIVVDRLMILQEQLDFSNQTWREIFKELLLEISKSQNKKCRIDIQDFLLLFHSEKNNIQNNTDVKGIIKYVFL
jgi:hypothetical protein